MYDDTGCKQVVQSSFAWIAWAVFGGKLNTEKIALSRRASRYAPLGPKRRRIRPRGSQEAPNLPKRPPETFIIIPWAVCNRSSLRDDGRRTTDHDDDDHDDHDDHDDDDDDGGGGGGDEDE